MESNKPTYVYLKICIQLLVIYNIITCEILHAMHIPTAQVTVLGQNYVATVGK